jgi:peptidoglycan-associated lipoprotein
MKVSTGYALLAAALLLAGCSSKQADLPPAAPVVQQAQPGVPNSGGVGAAPGSEQDFMLNVGRRVFFTEGSASLDSTAKATVRNQADWLRANPQWKVKIQGFADDPGSEAQQKTLSQKRADAVKNEIIAQGIAGNRVWAKGYGRDRLVGTCAELECKAQNRRTVTNLQDGSEPQ